ncbi:MAG: hypothetical protein L6R40_001794 [Gallowayella cf. fulva]|nr:MAG: hypothetical protein L6R40_001794 [Xanthomendoza cf. fulva]
MSVTLHTTQGDLKIEVFCETVPKTAENFLALCASSFYTSSPFHRSYPGFIIQTGSPSSGGPKVSISIYGSLFEDEIRPSLRHNARGIVSMANKGPGTNGSQFFILFAPAPHLDGKNTVFGKLVGQGSMETLEKLEAVEADAKGKVKGDAKIKGVTIHANPLAG